ncbi:MAG: hypothetical protein ACOC0H_03910 [Thermodesulfobacteriota bacterium]
MKKMHHHRIVVALDIDDFLTSMQVDELRNRDWRDPVHHSDNHFFTVEFEHNGVPYEVENVLTPGCIEFFRFLFEQERVRPAFFSSGIRSRNLDLAEKVVQMAMDAGGDPQWKKCYDVYSREDCFDTERMDRRLDAKLRDRFQPVHYFGNFKKDLRMIHYGREAYQQMVEQTFRDPGTLLPNPEKDEAILANLVLVEEDASYLFPGQEKNMLLCPTYRHPHPYAVNYQGDDVPPPSPNTWDDSFKAANTIFYAAGVLHRVFELVSENMSLPDALWQEQGRLWVDPKRYQERYPLHFFAEGRDILRKYNPRLNFAVDSIKIPGP